MEYLKRDIDRFLTDWVTESNRKPLLIRGARQVGKSSAVRELSKQFDFFVELNFEEHRQIGVFFEGDLTPSVICENLSAYFNTLIIPGRTLLFFDEIQACPNAISSIRFFYEKYPELHLIAAGSLLEFALRNLPSFGVGRIRSIFMQPFSFNEFLVASGEEALLQLIENSSAAKPMALPFHTKLTDLIKKFYLIGGMPEVVAHYVRHRDLLVCQQILEDLIISFKSDFSKYHERVPELRLLEVLSSVVQQAGTKFVFSNIHSQSNHKQLKDALDLLILAGLVIPVTHTSANGLPLGAEINYKKRKMLVFDTGIFQRLSGLNFADILVTNEWSVVNKGAIAEQFVGLELLKSTSPFQRDECYYWHRESLNSNAEVDYVIAHNSIIYPIEVKSNTSGSMRSMNLFMKEKSSETGIRCSLENFAKYDKIRVYPLYAVKNIFLE